MESQGLVEDKSRVQVQAQGQGVGRGGSGRDRDGGCLRGGGGSLSPQLKIKLTRKGLRHQKSV